MCVHICSHTHICGFFFFSERNDSMEEMLFKAMKYQPFLKETYLIRSPSLPCVPINLDFTPDSQIINTMYDFSRTKENSIIETP